MALLQEPILTPRGGEDGLARRVEGRQRLVAPQLDDRTAVLLDRLAGDRREPGGELRGGLVAALLREQGVPADVRDQ
jgi:hypothetical protein